MLCSPALVIISFMVGTHQETISVGDGGTTTSSSTDGWNSVPLAVDRRRSQPRRSVQDENAWSSAPPQIEYIPAGTSNTDFRPYLLLLAGLPGSGKSTFARSLTEAMPHKFERVNQDEMKSRKKCVSVAKKAMAKGKCIVVDRCNFDLDQRAVWYHLAKEFHYPVDTVILTPPISLCIRRCQERGHHETIAPSDAHRVVNMVQRQWQLPTLQEQLQSVRNYQVVRSSDEFRDTLMFHLHQT